MKYFHYKLSALTGSPHAGMCGVAARVIFIIAATAYATIATAGTTNEVKKTAENTTAYVDSVFQWGAWELDIEPAAGGSQTATTHPLQTRESSVTFRTNSISALAPLQPAGAKSVVPEVPVVIPVIPPPVTPPVILIPVVVPISTNVPVPTGAP